MPVNVLYCEGNSGSIDIRVIRQLLPNGCTIQPIGGKNYGLEHKIISDRGINPRLAGLIDRDFVGYENLDLSQKSLLMSLLREF